MCPPVASNSLPAMIYFDRLTSEGKHSGQATLIQNLLFRLLDTPSIEIFNILIRETRTLTA